MEEKYLLRLRNITPTLPVNLPFPSSAEQNKKIEHDDEQGTQAKYCPYARGHSRRRHISQLYSVKVDVKHYFAFK